jgi:deoxyribodipyrimidine photolyase
LSELIWRDFYQQVLWHHPQVVERAFRPEYDRITGKRTMRCFPPGATVAPAIRWSTPPCCS